jgi:tetratricopeptide (TPR) repeat protein
MRALGRFIGVCLMAWMVCRSSASDFQVDFDQANRALAQGKFADATHSYQGILKTGSSASLHNNLGLAFFQSGQIGPAIAQFRLAERLAPRDGEIKANLRLARAKLSKSITVDDVGLQALSLNEWALLPLGMIWIAAGTWFLSVLNPRAGSILRGYTWGAGVLFIILSGLAARAAVVRYQEPDLVVVRPDAALRQSPFPEAKSILNLAEGAELHTENVRAEWLLVRDPASDRSGWVRQDMVVRVPVR